MALKHNFCHDVSMRLSAYEEMVDGHSFIQVHYGHEEIRLPIAAWRKLNASWNSNRWDEKFDDLDVCVPAFDENLV